MTSRTALARQIRDLAQDDVRRTLDDAPALIDLRDERGRTWLHLCCSVDVAKRPDGAAASVAIADDLLARGLDLDDAAFVEADGRWRATPLWYCVSRGHNNLLAEHLLGLGCDPNHSLWAAAFNSDVDAVDLLVAHGADIDPVVEDETPFLAAIKTSHFTVAWRLAHHGADIDFVDQKGLTALHYMLRKSSATEHIVALCGFGPRLDIPDPTGTTAGDLLARKRDPVLRRLATTLA